MAVEPLEPPERFEWFVRFRERLGMQVVAVGPGAASAILQALRDNHIVCLLSDRLVGPTAGVEVNFFGAKAKLPAGPVTLAVRSGAPLMAAAIYYGQPAISHTIVFRPPLEIAAGERFRTTVEAGTQALASELERLIRDAPSQWHITQPNWPGDPQLHSPWSLSWLTGRPRAAPTRPGQGWHESRPPWAAVRVGMVCPYSLSLPGGVQGQVLGIARAMRKMGVEARVLAPCDGPPPESWITPLGASVPAAGNGSIAPIAPDPSAALRTIRALRDERFDIVHLHEPFVPGPTMTALLFSDGPLVGTFHRAGRHRLVPGHARPRAVGGQDAWRCAAPSRRWPWRRPGTPSGAITSSSGTGSTSAKSRPPSRGQRLGRPSCSWGATNPAKDWPCS